MIKYNALTSLLDKLNFIYMKPADKKTGDNPTVVKPEQVAANSKQSSGDKAFDEAIDRLLKKPHYQTSSK
jgi:hypothetical protein